jgi:hypothetical protein
LYERGFKKEDQRGNEANLICTTNKRQDGSLTALHNQSRPYLSPLLLMTVLGSDPKDVEKMGSWPLCKEGLHDPMQLAMVTG